MLRRIALLVLLVFLMLFMRRSTAKLSAAARERQGMRRQRRGSGGPERMVCGDCGTAFDPEQSGWLCPKCRK